ncbi:hypothetical protein RHSIM_Rhsim06G0038000 [Rhododendron simsii]|uniref:Uncharacterized protein n=1 Tax=Rhododendron simsii TaxID=118357 RepID=A0A834LNG7_RHOSS|nr:hypothetical protein RHSIM_Rhsim06G0038000 [Rhododendron simsii]
MLREVIAVEDPEGSGKLNKFLWVRVWINVTKPLKKGFFSKRVDEEDLWVSSGMKGCRPTTMGVAMNDCSDSDDFTPETSRETLTCMADDRDGLYDGGACQTQPESHGDEARGNTLCTEEVAHENVGNRVVQPESGRVSRPEEALLVQGIKMTAGLLDELALNSHGPNGDAQLECSRVRTTADIPDLTRVVFNPSSPSGISHGDQE